MAYIPNGKIVGLSKIQRVDAFARRMQVQERLTDQIKNCIQDALDPAWCSCCNRSAAHVYANAWYSKTKFCNNYLIIYRSF
jgi:GTP cyclohydrolase I